MAVRLTSSNDNQLQLMLDGSEHNPTLVAALQPILDGRRKVADAQTAVDQTKARLDSLRSDEDRQRANIVAAKADLANAIDNFSIDTKS